MQIWDSQLQLMSMTMTDSRPARPPSERSLRLCHVFPGFDSGGSQVRTATLMNFLGGEARHAILPLNGQADAISYISSEISCEILPLPSRRSAWSYPLELRRTIRRFQPDVVLTYNWGAMDAVLGVGLGMACPVVHTEDGFGPEEAERLKTRRVLARRVLLNRIWGTVVPSMTLMDIALKQFRIAPHKVHYIPNGVDAQRFRPGSNLELRSRLGVLDGDIVFGYVGCLRPEKNLGLLLQAFAAAEKPAGSRLVLVGDGPCRRDLENQVDGLGLRKSVIFPGAVGDPTPWYQTFDVFTMSSTTEQMPLSLLEAMACGLPAVCTGVGDTARLLGDSDEPAVVPRSCVSRFASALSLMARDGALRRRSGAKYRNRCLERYSLSNMIQSYRRLYEAAALGRRYESVQLKDS